jgi:hypothetical protein
MKTTFTFNILHFKFYIPSSLILLLQDRVLS